MELSYTTISPHLNSKFAVHFPPIGMQELELIKAEEKNCDQLESFSLIFAGLPEKLLPQQNHSFSHPQLGCFEMFITPINTSTPKQIHYQAVFNMLKTKF